MMNDDDDGGGDGNGDDDGDDDDDDDYDEDGGGDVFSEPLATTGDIHIQCCLARPIFVCIGP